ncbi:MAG: hypothetical protein FJ295_21505 [Planctomycetes bacterium]|nr:hypothetical protein [Planctomycetota bacterium]
MTDTQTTPETQPTSMTAVLPRRALPVWAQIGVLLVVFVADGIVGAMIATKIIRSRMEYYREHADALPSDIVPRLQVRLALTDEQTKQVRETIERRHPRLIEQRRQGAQAMLNEFQLMEDEIAGVLDPKQQQQWRTIATSVRHRFLPPAPGIE